MRSRADALRTDGVLFYSLTLSSFLESTVPRYVDSLCEIFAADPAVCEWLSGTWQPEEALHGAWARDRVAATWPEFEWTEGYAVFRRAYEPLCRADELRPTPALEALARCVTETQATMAYRSLAAYTRDSALRDLLLRMSRDEVSHYNYFRHVFQRHDRRERNSLWRKARVLAGRSGLVRDEDLAVPFAAINRAWTRPAPFRMLRYPEFLQQSAAVMRGFLDTAAASRMLLKPLGEGAFATWFLAPMLASIVRRQFAI